MKNTLLGAVALVALPMAAANAQSMFTPGPANPGFYIGGEGGLNWLLNNNSYSMNTGWAAGGKIGYDFVGPRLELEGMYRQNNGTGTAQNVQLTGATLGSANGTPVAQTLGDLAPGGGSAVVTVTYTTAAASGTAAVEKYTGSYVAGTFAGSIRATLP